jgi:aspartate aminotransferase
MSIVLVHTGSTHPSSVKVFAMVFFDRVPLAPSDPILGLTIAFQNDLRNHKVNLGVGLYKTDDLKTPVLESVKQAEAALLEEEQSKEYLPIDGDRLYLEQMGALVFGQQLWSEQKEKIASFQSIGGTGALKIGGTFIREELPHPIWIPTPTWPNHRGVFSHCGLKVENYPYYNLRRHCLDWEAMVSRLENLSAGTVVLLHACCHNPTGSDPSKEQWKTLCAIFREKRLIPFFDFAYQGFGCGVEEDAEAIRLFFSSHQEMLVAVSNAKNLSLYGERVGCLFIASSSAKTAEHISSRVKQIVRTNYSNPPMHGAKVAAYIFNQPSLRGLWQEELDTMRKRILKMRKLFTRKLSDKATKVDFSHIDKGSGMFGFTGLNKLEVDKIRVEYGIYMPSDGRINVCGLNMDNIDSVVDAIIAVTEGLV